MAKVKSVVADVAGLARRLAVIAAAFAAVALQPALAQGLPLIRDAEIERFLDDHSRPILRVAGIDPDSIEILVVNDGSFNAFAGGRYMGFNTGLLTTAQTPNEVEAVIAHEVGHLAGGHSARRADAYAAASRPVLLSLVLAGAAIAAGAPDAGVGILSLGQTVGTANALKYTRGQEATADQSSITYLDALGKSSKGALDLWRRLRNDQIITGFRINPYFQTHPLANARLTALTTRAEQSPHFEKTDAPAEIERLRYIQAKIWGFLHDPTATLRKYPLSDQSGPARYARAVAYYRVARIDEALDEIDLLLVEQAENPYFQELRGQMLFEFGRADEAIAPHRRSVELLPDSALLRINLGRALLATGEPALLEEAVAELNRATLLERANAFAWFELARAYGALDNEPMALLATAESRYYGGAPGDARQFANRALKGLANGSPEWRQAMDIVNATRDAKGEGARGDGRGLQPRAAPSADPATP